MCRKKELFIKLTEEVHRSVSLRDDSKLSVEGKGCYDEIDILQYQLLRA